MFNLKPVRDLVGSVYDADFVMVDTVEQTGASTEGPTVLVIDDEIDASEFMPRHLHKAGFQVHKAEHGGVALEILEENPADLVLLDLEMPEMDGYVEAIVGKGPHGPEKVIRKLQLVLRQQGSRNS